MLVGLLLGVILPFEYPGYHLSVEAKKRRGGRAYDATYSFSLLAPMTWKVQSFDKQVILKLINHVENEPEAVCVACRLALGEGNSEREMFQEGLRLAAIFPSALAKSDLLPTEHPEKVVGTGFAFVDKRINWIGLMRAYDKKRWHICGDLCLQGRSKNFDYRIRTIQLSCVQLKRWNVGEANEETTNLIELGNDLRSVPSNNCGSAVATIARW